MQGKNEGEDNNQHLHEVIELVDEPIKANHPFFWAGYMLIDSGSEPAIDAVEEKIEEQDDSGD